MAALPLILEVQTGKYKGRKIRVSEPQLIVGRGEDSNVRIASSEVSREHCVLIPKRHGVLVRDLDSRNGTFINGRPISGEGLLPPGGVLTVGPLTFLLLGDPIEAPPAPPSKPDVAVQGKTGVDQDLSDDDIASWLADESDPGAATSDTTVIKASARETAPVTPPPESPTPPTAVVRRREFKTVAEEAQDIIRRHLELIKQSEVES